MDPQGSGPEGHPPRRTEAVAPPRKGSFRKPDARAPPAAPIERASGRAAMRKGVGRAGAQPARAAGRQSQMPDRKAAGIAPQVEEPTGSRPELSGSGQGSPLRQTSEGPAPLVRLKEVETGRFRPNRIRTGLEEGLRFLVQVRRLEGSGFASILKVRETGCGRISVLMRSGGRERGLLRPELRRVEVRGLALGRMTWRQKAGGSPSVDVANGLGVGAFALRRKVRRRGNGACSALAPRRIEDEEFASRATSGSGRIEVRLDPRLQTDRGGELASMSKIRRRKDRSLLRFEAANGSRRGVRFSSKVRWAEGSGFASISRLAKRVRQDR